MNVYMLGFLRLKIDCENMKPKNTYETQVVCTLVKSSKVKRSHSQTKEGVESVIYETQSDMRITAPSP